jgi:hypothetical protein
MSDHLMLTIQPNSKQRTGQKFHNHAFSVTFILCRHKNQSPKIKAASKPRGRYP